MEIDRVRTLETARDQLILSLHLRSIFSGSFGSFESLVAGFSLGPFIINKSDLSEIDTNTAAWGIERLATQNLAITLNTALEEAFANRLSHTDPGLRDYFCLVAGLRNAFAHDPYEPTWELRDERNRRLMSVPNCWDIDLTNRHETVVEDKDFRYASGLLRLVEVGMNLLKDPHASPFFFHAADL